MQWLFIGKYRFAKPEMLFKNIWVSKSWCSSAGGFLRGPCLRAGMVGSWKALVSSIGDYGRFSFPREILKFPKGNELQLLPHSWFKYPLCFSSETMTNFWMGQNYSPHPRRFWKMTSHLGCCSFGKIRNPLIFKGYGAFIFSTWACLWSRPKAQVT